MKQQLYHIGDRAFFNAIERTCRALSKHEHKYIVVGGIAFQLHIANQLSSGKKSIDQLINEGSLSEGENIRRTSACDIAMTLNPGSTDLLKTIEVIEGEEITDDNIYDLKWKRIGKKRPIGRIVTLNEEEEALVAFNFSLEPKDLWYIGQEWYQRFIDSGQCINLTNSDLKGTFRVGKPEHLVSAKLTRNRAKDQFDIQILLDLLYRKHIDFDFEEVKSILGVQYIDTHEHFYDGRMIRQMELDKIKLLIKN